MSPRKLFLLRMLPPVFLSLVVVASFSIGLAETEVQKRALSDVSSDSPPDVEWEQTYGGPVASVPWLIQTSDGGYAMVGSIGSGEVKLIKTDESGEMQWNQTYEAWDIETVLHTSDSGYALACNGKLGAMLVKTDSDGALQWSKSYSAREVNSMVITADEGYMLAGATKGGDIHASDVCLTKVDQNGQLQWSKTYGGEGDEAVESVIQTGDGGYAFAGYTESFGNGGRPLHYSNVDIRQTCWLVKVDSTGNLQWVRTFGEAGINGATSLVQTDDGGYVLAGNTNSIGAGGHDAWLIKTDSLGYAVWNRTYGGPEQDFANSLIRTSDGGLAFVGSTPGSGAGGGFEIIWLVKTDAYGNQQWSQTYARTVKGRVCLWEAYCLIETSDGGLAVFGWGTDGQGRNLEGYYFYLIKTEPFLPPPTPFLPPDQPQYNPDPVPSLAFPTTTIRADGSVDPSTAPIQRNGKVYRFTGNLNGPLIIEKDEIIVDGAGHALLGNGTIGELYIRVSGTGISLTGRSNVTIKDLTVEEYMVAINISSCSHITLEGNTISENCEGIHVADSCPKLKISNNAIQANDGYAIWLIDVGGSLISGNRVIDNSGSSAIYIRSGFNNIIVGNIIEDCGDGVSLGSSMNNSIIGNHFVNNSAGVFLRGSSDNMIYCNNFIKSTAYLMDQVGVYNSWDDGTVGNYWSDYLKRYSNASEVDNSGVGDIPYVLESTEGTNLRLPSAENTDHYPLMSPVSRTRFQVLQQNFEQIWDSQQPLDFTTIAVIGIAIVTVLLVVLVLRTRKKGN